METRRSETAKQTADAAEEAGSIGRERGRFFGARRADAARRGAGEAGAAGARRSAQPTELAPARPRRSCSAQTPLVEQLQSEMNALRAERDQVRQRVERLLKQLDALEL